RDLDGLPHPLRHADERPGGDAPDRASELAAGSPDLPTHRAPDARAHRRGGGAPGHRRRDALRRPLRRGPGAPGGGAEGRRAAGDANPLLSVPRRRTDARLGRGARRSPRSPHRTRPSPPWRGPGFRVPLLLHGPPGDLPARSGPARRRRGVRVRERLDPVRPRSAHRTLRIRLHASSRGRRGALSARAPRPPFAEGAARAPTPRDLSPVRRDSRPPSHARGGPMNAVPRAELRDLDPYQSPQPPVSVRLNTNESPHAPSDAFREELADAARRVALNRYPDREAEALREALARHTGHPVEGIWAANGSNEVIEQLLLAHGGPGRTVVVFEPTYALHRRLSWIAHSPVDSVPLSEPWRIGSEHVERALAADPRVVFVCSPNNPTGNAQPVTVVQRLASASEALVVVDEAYIEFGGESALPLVRARIGYCLAAPEVVEDLRRVRLPYHLSALTQAAGLGALRHADEAGAILTEIRAQRNRLVAEIRAMGAETFASEANFVLFRPPKPAPEVWRGLLERGVLVRDMTEAVPGCLRVTAGTRAEVDRFLEALAEVLR